MIQRVKSEAQRVEPTAMEGDFPGGPVVNTPRFHGRGLGFGELRSRMLRSAAKKKKELWRNIPKQEDSVLIKQAATCASWI